ncbi:MAG TPA: ATPase, T2SS/T4P/T4SS family [Phycisphaeraceae bacterium]
MEFWIFDHSTSTRRTLEVNGEPITLGRSDRCAIVLAGPFVAPMHARIIRRGNQLFLEALCHAGTRVAGKEVWPGQAVPVDFGDEIQIGPYSVAAVRAAAGEAAGPDEAEHQRRLMRFEQEVHAQLLERMNLRVTGQPNLQDARFVAQMLEQLGQILDRRLDELDGAAVQHTLRMHLHRLVIAEVVRQAQGRVSTDYRADDERATDAAMEQQVAQLVSAMVDAMPLILEPASVQEDLASAEEAFEGLWRQHAGAVDSSLRRYIVRQTVFKDIRDTLLGLGPLQDLLEMPTVTEIMVVGRDRIYVEKNGVVQPTTRSFFSDEVLLAIIERILAPVGRRVDTSTPLVDARLPDGSRVNVVINPLSLVGPCLTIRKFGWIPFTLDDLIARGSVSEPCARFLQGCVIGRKNLIVSGGTSSGKTTLLNVLSAHARPTERIITIEESAELQLPQPHVVRLEGRPANVEGRGAYAIRELVRNALRMRPDRIIVGEVRGPEALDMLQAMNTGHDGSLSTLHANSPQDAMRRLETLVLMAVDMPVRAIREQIASALDVVVQVARFSNGRRRVTHIAEVTGIEPDTGQVHLENIFVLRDPEQPRLRHTGYIPSFAEQLIEREHIGVEVFL